MSAETIAGYCRACGKALAEADVHKAQGAMYCKEHVPQEGAQSSPYASPYAAPYTSPQGSVPPPPPGGDISPGLAFLLGLIPGVGAIYNGQYAKGLVHVAVVGVLISILNADVPERIRAAGGVDAGGVLGIHALRGVSHSAEPAVGSSGG